MVSGAAPRLTDSVNWSSRSVPVFSSYLIDIAPAFPTREVRIKRFTQYDNEYVNMFNDCPFGIAVTTGWCIDRVVPSGLFGYGRRGLGPFVDDLVVSTLLFRGRGAAARVCSE